MKIDDETIDTIKELINIGCGSGAGILNQIVRSHITLHAPLIKIISDKNLLNEQLAEYKNYVCVNINVTGDLKGLLSLLLTEETFNDIVKRVASEDALTDSMDEMKIGVIEEIGNIILSSIICTISNLYRLRTKNSLPSVQTDIEKYINSIITEEKYSHYVLVEAKMSVDKLNMNFNILMLFQDESFQFLIENIGSISLFNIGKG